MRISYLRGFLSAFLIATASALTSHIVVAQDIKHLEARMTEMQARYESRLASLEKELTTLRNSVGDPAATTRSNEIDRVIGEHTQHDRHYRLDHATHSSNSFCPAISFVSDFVVGASSRDNTYETDNQFRLRLLELGITGRVDPSLSYKVTLHGSEEALELDDAYVDWQSGSIESITLRAGRLPIDFGRASPLHNDELAFIDKPYVIQSILGGRALTTGIAVHQRFDAGGTPVRWSLGLGNSLDGDFPEAASPLSYNAYQQSDTGAGSFGSRSASDMIVTSRVASSLQVSAGDELQLGVSGIIAPKIRRFDYLDPPTNSIVARHDTDHLVIGLDAFYRHNAGAHEGSLTIGGEWIWARYESVDISTSPPSWLGAREFAHGGYLMAEWAFCHAWSVGVRIDHISPNSDTSDNWDSANAAITFHADEVNRIRLEGGIINDRFLDETYGFLMLQWTVIIGHHTHAVAW